MFYGCIRWKQLVLPVVAAAVAAAAALYFQTAAAAPAGTGNVEEEGITLPVIMYHSMLKEAKRQGKYVISPDTFEADLLYLKSRGYHTVTVAQLIDYTDHAVPLPEKPVMLTFDDGYYNTYLYAYPLAKKYGAKIIIAPVGYYTDLYSEKDADHANYSYLTWDEISDMIASGSVEFLNHSYQMHTIGERYGAARKAGESAAAYAEALQNDAGKLQAEMLEKTGYTPPAFVYPFGASSKESDGILKQMGFRATFFCTEKLNTITRNPESLYSLGRFLRPSGISSETFFKKICVN